MICADILQKRALKKYKKTFLWDVPSGVQKKVRAAYERERIKRGREFARQMARDGEERHPQSCYRKGLLDERYLCECGSCDPTKIGCLMGDLPQPTVVRDHHKLCHCVGCVLSTHSVICGCMWCDDLRPGYSTLAYIIANREGGIADDAKPGTWPPSMMRVHALIEWGRAMKGLARKFADSDREYDEIMERVRIIFTGKVLTSTMTVKEFRG